MPDLSKTQLHYVKIKARKTGLDAHYVQVKRSGRSIRIRSAPSDFKAYILEYNDAVQELRDEDPTIDRRCKPGRHKVAALIQAFEDSGALNGLRPATQRNYTYAFNTINRRFAKVRYDKLTKHAIALWLDDLPPFSANMALAAMRRVINWCLDRDYVETDPTRNIKSNRKSKDGFPAWPEDMAARFSGHHLLGTHERLCFDLLQYTGLRVADVIALGPQHIEADQHGEYIRRTCQKTRKEINIPLHPLLKESIEQSETGDETFLRMRRFDRPYADSKAFGEVFRQACRSAGVQSTLVERSLSGHGLRKTVAIRALENGATTHDVMAFQGWGTTAMVDHYAREIDRKRIGRSKGHLMFKTPPETVQD